MILLDRASAAKAAGNLSVSTLEKLVREGKFPAPRRVSGNRVAWLQSEIVAWAEKLPVSDLPPPRNTSGRKR